MSYLKLACFAYIRLATRSTGVCYPLGFGNRTWAAKLFRGSCGLLIVALVR
jgi:hypothetical protein